MSTKRIKGITVEIGGDLTSLDKALKSTNDSLSNTQKNLKDVERLLKLDPKNVELLDQKQRLLAQSAEQTADKLKTIQEVLDNSTASNVRYDAWTKSFASMQGQITKTENALESLDKKKKELQSLGFAIDSAPMVEVQQEIDSATDKLEALQKKVTDTYEEMGRPISIDQFDALQRELADAKNAADEAEKAFKNFHPTLEKVGSTAQDVSDKAGKVADAFAPISKAAGAALTAMFATVPATDDLRTNLSRLETNAQQAGIGLDATSDALTQFNRVSGDTDASVEALSNLLMAGATESNLQRAVENLAGAATAFPDTIKIESLADSLQETIATGEATGQFAELLDRLGVSTERFNAQIGQTQDQSVRLNMAMDALANEGMADYYNAWITGNEELTKNKDATLELQTSLADLATALTPIVTMVTGFATKLLDWFNDIGPGGQAAIITILGLVAAISPIAGMISNIGGAVGTLTKLAGVFSGGAGEKVYLTFAKWALIIMAVVAAVAALIAMINVLIGKGDETSRVLGNLNGGGGGKGGGSSYPVNTGVPGFATGGVFMPNHPVLGVLGDNRQEPEIAAPRSAMQEAFLDALDRRGGARGTTKVSIEFRGSLAQLGRVLQPVITTETARQGQNLLKG
ncbi:MAG: hypothetical protein MSK39_10270 [Dysosmobacter sp.]|nr:hypothetical protein [Dysosmobacter sp.]